MYLCTVLTSSELGRQPDQRPTAALPYDYPRWVARRQDAIRTLGVAPEDRGPRDSGGCFAGPVFVEVPAVREHLGFRAPFRAGDHCRQDDEGWPAKYRNECGEHGNYKPFLAPSEAAPSTPHGVGCEG